MVRLMNVPAEIASEAEDGLKHVCCDVEGAEGALEIGHMGFGDNSWSGSCLTGLVEGR